MADRYFVPFGGAGVYDRLVGCARAADAIAECSDSDMAHRIVRLLNNDERARNHKPLDYERLPLT